VLSLRLPREGRFHGCLAELSEAAEYVPESLWDQPAKLFEALRMALVRAPLGVARAAACWARRRAAFRDLWQAAMVRRWAQRRGVGHLHCHFGGFAATVAHLARRMGGPPYSVTLHAHDIFRDTVDHAWLRRIIAGSAFVVTVSRYNEAYLGAQVGADTRRVRVLYNGIPLDRFPFYTGPREKGTLLAVGRLIEKKGFIHLVRACRPLVENGLLRRCDIVGEGREQAALAAEIKRLGLDGVVRLAGAWPQERVAEALARASAFALPCVAARDGNMDALPTVLLEAMAAGCPIVSTRLSGIPEIVADGGTGLLVEPGDEPGLARALSALLTDPARAAAFASAGRRRVEDLFDGRRNTNTLAAWLNASAGGAEQAAEEAPAPARLAAPRAALARE
jgi:glycosyltransferase involved in cell wall biosynthesis